MRQPTSIAIALLVFLMTCGCISRTQFTIGTTIDSAGLRRHVDIAAAKEPYEDEDCKMEGASYFNPPGPWPSLRFVLPGVKYPEYPAVLVNTKITHKYGYALLLFWSCYQVEARQTGFE